MGEYSNITPTFGIINKGSMNNDKNSITKYYVNTPVV